MSRRKEREEDIHPILRTKSYQNRDTKQGFWKVESVDIALGNSSRIKRGAAYGNTYLFIGPLTRAI